MRIRRRAFFGLLAGMALLEACSQVPLTGRNQLNIIPDATMLSLSFDQYGQFLKENKLSADAARTAVVKRVGKRIQAAVEDYFSAHNLSRELVGYNWEFNLVENPEVNAWCMPGGKVVVYTGILPLAGDENGLAVIMGHEIAHAVAKHGNERLSQQLLAQMGGLALTEALNQKPEQTRALWRGAFGVGAQLGVLLPYSRLQENEADRLGLIFMAMAGYNLNGAVDFWERMAQAGGGKPPAFLSTHPSSEARIRSIKAEIPEAMTYFRKASDH